MIDNPYILFSGPTGVGKSTAINNLVERLNSYELYTDPYEKNPFISDAYNNNNFVFQSQVFFLKEFLKIHKKINNSNNIILQERSVFESIHIFCKMFLLQGKFTNDEFSLISDLANLTTCGYRRPTVILYFQASVDEVIRRIQYRNRNFEQNINIEFIETQCMLYEEWITGIEKSKSSKIIRIESSGLPQEVSEIVNNIALGYI